MIPTSNRVLISGVLLVYSDSDLLSTEHFCGGAASVTNREGGVGMRGESESVSSRLWH